MPNLKEAQAVYNATFTFDQLLYQALHLPPIQKVQLVEKLMGTLQKELTTQPVEPQPRRSLYGLLADLGTAPSAEEIDLARAEAWDNFPRDDV